MANPKVSVVILNWNGKKFLRDCLTSLRAAKYSPLEVILVDNNSTDDSVMYVRKHFPWVRLIASKKNLGFAEGNNIGFKKSTGKYVLFLNNDTKVTPHFLEPMVRAMESDPSIGCIQPQMRVMKNPSLQDEAGGYLTRAGFLYHYGYRKKYSAPIYKKRREVFSAKGACMLIPRTVFQHVGMFDRDFFIFFEETDLCFRIWLAGYRVLYDPATHIFHHVGGDTTDKYSYARRIYLTFKNMTCSYAKNFGLYNFLTIYPFFLGVQVILACFYAVTGKWHLLRAIWDAYVWNILHWKKTLAKRRMIQTRIRRVSDIKLAKHIMQNPALSYLYYSFRTTEYYPDAPIRTHET